MTNKYRRLHVTQDSDGGLTIRDMLSNVVISIIGRDIGETEAWTTIEFYAYSTNSDVILEKTGVSLRDTARPKNINVYTATVAKRDA